MSAGDRLAGVVRWVSEDAASRRALDPPLASLWSIVLTATRRS